MLGISVLFACLCLELQGCVPGVQVGAPQKYSRKDFAAAAQTGLILMIVTSVIIPLWFLLSAWYWCEKCPKRIQEWALQGPTEVRFPRQFLCICVRAICPILVIPANILSWILWSYNTSNMTCENLATFEPELCGHLSWTQPYGAGFSASECCI
jgi:hypothetical protein